MEKLLAELRRLYLPPDADRQDAQLLALERRLQGQAGVALDLATPDGRVRALAMPFDRIRKAEEGAHWRQLCVVANALQAELGLPAPAVSISGDIGYHLWLSLASPVPLAQAHELLALLRAVYLPELEPSAAAPVDLPPYLNERSGTWAGFIHPGMGASFAEDPGLEMMPPLSGQVAFLAELDSIEDAGFLATLARLRERVGERLSERPGASAPARPAGQAATQLAEGLLLKDATLEDIVRFLHAKNIEPTFRHLLPK